MNPPSVCIIIPCHNESANILKVLESLQKTDKNFTIVVVDDGSQDNSVELIKSVKSDKIIPLVLPFNCGIGTAVETGLLYAWRHNADYAVKFDGDGQHLAEEISLLLDVLDKDEADLVVGSRFVADNEGFKSTAIRRVGIRFFHALSWLLTGQGIADSTSGFRAYNRKALAFAAKYYPSFDYPEPEENILFLRNKFRVKEVPCRMNIRQGGRSSIRPWKALYYMVKVALAMTMAALRAPVIR